MDLLLGISIQNGGRTVRIYEGYGDAVTQMETFYLQELGMVMLSDVNVQYDGGDNIQLMDSTVSQFPVLADGSEIVVRGKIESSVVSSSVTRQQDNEFPLLRTMISALSAQGAQSWSTDFVIEPMFLTTPVSECRQTFAQARILELLDYRDAERALGDELFGRKRRKLSTTASSLEEEAQELALDTGLVWPGLTAMVTVQSDTCTAASSTVCNDGEGNGGGGSAGDLSLGLGEEDPTAGRAYNSGYSSSGHRALSNFSILVSGLAGAWLVCAL
jgi:hypothetical protein